jgi:hypothetical protein
VNLEQLETKDIQDTNEVGAGLGGLDGLVDIGNNPVKEAGIQGLGH